MPRPFQAHHPLRLIPTIVPGPNRLLWPGAQRLILLGLILCLSFASANLGAGADTDVGANTRTSQARTFPRPSGLQPAIEFWKRVYSEFDTASGLVHDSRDLSVCYTPLYLNRGAPLASQDRAIEETIDQYRVALLTLADGKRADLSLVERRALEPWRKRGGGPDELRAAADRIRFQRGQEDRFRAGLERSRVWKQQVETIFREQGLPPGLAALAHVESSYNPKAVSKVGAAGLWQFMPATARRYLQVDEEIDERFDVIKSTRAAANLLHHNFSVLDSWPLAITAYNHGLAGVRRAVQSTGSQNITRIIDTYQGAHFGFASRNFYVAFLAAHDLSKRPDRYFRDLDATGAINLTAPAFLPAPALAAFFGISLHDLRAVNPGIHQDIWNGKQLIARGDHIRLPPPIRPGRVTDDKFNDFANRYGFDSQLPIDHHDLSYGESLSVIAQRLGTQVTKLVTLNGLDDAHTVKTGQRLQVPAGKIPQPLGPEAAMLLSDLLSLQRPRHDAMLVATQASDPSNAVSAAAEPGIETQQSPPPSVAAPLTEIQPDLAADPIDYSVKSDGSIEIQVAETLGHFAQWLTIDAKQLSAANALKDAQPLIIGQRLKLDFSRVSTETFEQRRIDFHRNRQLDYFSRYRITGVREHRIKEGQSLWDIAVETYQIPLWLLRQYNPDVNIDTVLPLDQPLYIPIVQVLAPDEPPRTAAGSGSP